MSFLVRTLEQHSVILASIRLPIIPGETSRVHKAIYNKIARRTDSGTVHVVMDMSSLDYDTRFPVEKFVMVMAKVYEAWHFERQLVLWISVHETYYEIVRYLAQRWCLPVYIRTDTPRLLREIDAAYGATGILRRSDVTG